MGVRVDDDGVLEQIEYLFAAHLVEDPVAGDDLGIALHGSGVAGGSLRPVLLHGNCPLLRTRSRPRLFRALDAFLGRVGADGMPAGTIALRDMGAIVHRNDAVLVPRLLLARSAGVERLIAGSGASVAEVEATRLDVVSGEVVVTAGLVGRPSAEDEPVVAAPGRYRLRGIHWLDADLRGDERPTRALVRMLARAWDLGTTDHGAVFEGLIALRSLSSTSPVVRSGTADVRAIVDDLRRDA